MAKALTFVELNSTLYMRQVKNYVNLTNHVNVINFASLFRVRTLRQ